MKENILPWYVRFDNFVYLPTSRQRKIKLLIGFMFFSVVVSIAEIILSGIHVPLYEKIYDMEFYDYVNNQLEEVYNKTIDEDGNIMLDSVPEIIKKYNIKYTNQGIQISYILDKEKTINEYYSLTGKNEDNPFLYMKKMKMDIKMSKDFTVETKNNYMNNIPTQKEYQQIMDIVIIVSALGMVLFGLQIINIPMAIATSIWFIKQERLMSKKKLS